MKVDSENIEFGYELISVLPYAYYLYNKGALKETRSGIDTECLYYFSPKHTINPERRNFHHISRVGYPNKRIHEPRLVKSQFMPPPLKQQYQNKIDFGFEKEVVIICNRHNIEWNVRPINFFDLPTLSNMFELLQNKYHVVYINVEGRPELYDHAPPEQLGDFELLKNYPKVINFHDLVKEHSFNYTQLCLFAQCSKFITMNGGHAILAAYFSGENIIMSKPGTPQAQELNKDVNSFYRWYKDFSGQRVIHVPDEVQLLERIKDMWIDCNPVANILIRTSNRPNFFKKCIQSIQKQTYKNINIWVSVDRPNNDYTIPYPVYPIFVNREQTIGQAKDETYGKPFPFNLYFNEMHKKIKDGIIFYLDDDDRYIDEYAIEKVVNEYKNGNELIFWRARVGEYEIPYPENFGREPILFQCSTISFAFDVKYKNVAVWEGFKRGDYRVAKKLYEKIKNVGYINEILAETQDGSHYGRDCDKLNESETKDKNNMEKQIKIKTTKSIFKGRKLSWQIGEIREYPISTAKGLINMGVAIEYHDDILEPVIEKIQEPEKIEKVVQPVKEIKRGRKSKK